MLLFTSFTDTTSKYSGSSLGISTFIFPIISPEVIGNLISSNNSISYCNSFSFVLGTVRTISLTAPTKELLSLEPGIFILANSLKSSKSLIFSNSLNDHVISLDEP